MLEWLCENLGGICLELRYTETRVSSSQTSNMRSSRKFQIVGQGVVLPSMFDKPTNLQSDVITALHFERLLEEALRIMTVRHATSKAQ
jgi:hypothetical protein